MVPKQLLRILFGVMWILAAFKKHRDQDAVRVFLGELGFGKGSRTQIAQTATVLEALVGGAYLSRSPKMHSWARTLGFWQLICYTAIVVHVIRGGRELACGCFGNLSQSAINSRTLLRNIILVALTYAEANWRSGSRAAPQLNGFTTAKATNLAARSRLPYVIIAILSVALVSVVQVYGRLLNVTRELGIDVRRLPNGVVGHQIPLIRFKSPGGLVHTSEDYVKSEGELLLLCITNSCKHCDSIKRKLSDGTITLDKSDRLWLVNFESRFVEGEYGRGDLLDDLVPNDMGIYEVPALLRLDVNHRLTGDIATGENAVLVALGSSEPN